MGPVLGGVGKEGLNSAHLSGVLDLGHELSVSEPFLGANLTGEVISLSDSSDGDNGSSVLLHLGFNL